MATAAAKPAKLTDALVNEYMDELVKLEAAKATCKPHSDKCKSLKEQIDAAFMKLGKDKKKVGSWLLSLFKKRGSVPWKAELTKRVSSDELAEIEAGVFEILHVDIQPA